MANYNIDSIYTGSLSGTERIRIDTSSGNVGIATTAPGAPLDVNGNVRSRDGGFTLTTGTTQQGGVFMYNRLSGSGTDYSTSIFSESGLGIYFAVNGSANRVMVLNSSGNLGIGTTSPGAKLHVAGSIYAFAADNSTINFSNTDSDNATYTDRGTRVLTSNGTNWAADGRDPILTLTRNSAGTTRGQSIGLLLHNENNSYNVYAPLIGFSAKSDSSDYNSIYAAIMGKKTGQNGGVDANWNKGELHFYAAGDAYMNDIPNMVINGTGIGIGTTLPELAGGYPSRLYVKGTPVNGYWGLANFETTLNSGDANHGIIGLYNSKSYAVGDDARIMFTFKNSDQSVHPKGSFGMVNTGDYTADFQWNTRTGGGAFSEKMRFTSGGNLGIGITNPGSLLHISGTNPDIRITATGGGVSYLWLNDGSSNGYLIKNRTNNTDNGALAGALYTYTDGNKAFQHIHGGTPLFTILSSGNVGIATTAPADKFHVVGQATIGGVKISTIDTGSTGNGIRFYGLAGDGSGTYNHAAIIERLWGTTDESELLIFKGNDPDTSTIHDRIRIAATGRIVFDSYNGYAGVDEYISARGTGNINGSLYINGNDTYSSGTVTAVIFNTTSDIRLKENVEPITDAIEKVNKLNGITYNFKENKEKRHAGLIAQEVLEILPEAVRLTEDDVYTISYSDVTALLVEAFKEQQRIIDSQNERITRLEKLINKLEGDL